MERTEKEVRKEIEKLRKCCEWNGWNMKSTPAYKSLNKKLNKLKGLK